MAMSASIMSGRRCIDRWTFASRRQPPRAAIALAHLSSCAPAMAKTLLTPTQQWRKSVSLTNDWVEHIRPALVELAKVYEIREDSWEKDRRLMDELYRSVAERWFRQSKRSNLHGYLSHLAASHNESWSVGRTWMPGVAQWNDRHLLKGDIVLVDFTNGRERHPVTTVTSKGHRIVGKYYDTDRLGARGTIIRIVDVPAELVGRQLADPDVEEFVLNLRAGTSASG